ncbi:MAG: hypothetical protein H6669_08390 [Ardenticatenaceae bacterium]|nr:hypothetical protein [Ardenticatenaceae bacterium]
MVNDSSFTFTSPKWDKSRVQALEKQPDGVKVASKERHLSQFLKQISPEFSTTKTSEGSDGVGIGSIVSISDVVG